MRISLRDNSLSVPIFGAQCHGAGALLFTEAAQNGDNHSSGLVREYWYAFLLCYS